MASRALGLIEVEGYLGAVVAADAALKAANVSLLNIETVKAGLNTVQLVGDVSAVRAAVDAAVDEIQDKPYYLASHVISRIDEQTKILFEKKRNQEPQETLPEPEAEALEIEEVEEKAINIVEENFPAEEVSEEVVSEESLAEEILEATVVEETVEELPSRPAETKPSASKYVRQDLEKLKVVKLRSLAYQEKEVGLSKKEIKFANKRVLVEALMKVARKE